MRVAAPTRGGRRPAGGRARGFVGGTHGVPSSDRWRSVTSAGGTSTQVTRTPIRRVRALVARQQYGTYAFLPPPGGLDHSGDHRCDCAELVLHQWSELPASRYLGRPPATQSAR